MIRRLLAASRWAGIDLNMFDYPESRNAAQRQI